MVNRDVWIGLDLAVGVGQPYLPSRDRRKEGAAAWLTFPTAHLILTRGLLRMMQPVITTHADRRAKQRYREV